MSTDGSFRSVINLGNSIIGVSILAMPYCFHKCGILLSVLLILASGCLTKATCHLLLKAAIMGRRRNFEFLAFHTFGTMGKFAVELGIIGFLLGTCIAFFVVVGDLGPPLAADAFFIENTPKLRIEVLLILGFFVGLPLGLLKRVESLTGCSTLSVCFYIFLIFKILSEALPNLSYEKLFYEMNWWQPSGLLSCLPIFAMALSCQTQLFEIFDTLNDPSLKRMDSVVSSAVHLCSAVYCMVGMFGYVAFYDEPISGNILVKLPSANLTKVIKLAFVLTVVVSFPLCLFPCRSSLHSLLFKPGVSVHDMPGNLIPDHRFRLLTFLLVAVTIGTAIMVPNIEFVLGLLGSTIGAIISYILPAMVFIRMTNKNTNERLLAKFILCVGIFILLACSYSTLHDSATKPAEPVAINALVLTSQSPLPNLGDKKIVAKKIEDQIPFKPNNVKIDEIPKIVNEVQKVESKVDLKKKEEDKNEKRQEPPIPQEPEEVEVNIKDKVSPTIKIEVKAKAIAPTESKPKEPLKEMNLKSKEQAANDIDPDALKKEDKELKNGRVNPPNVLEEQPPNKAEKTAMEAERKAVAAEKKAEEASQKQDELLRKIEAQQREQKKLLEEQRKLLLELKEHKESHRKEEEEKKAAEHVVNEVNGESFKSLPNSNQDNLPAIVSDANVPINSKLTFDNNIVKESLARNPPSNKQVVVSDNNILKINAPKDNIEAERAQIVDDKVNERSQPVIDKGENFHKYQPVSVLRNGPQNPVDSNVQYVLVKAQNVGSNTRDRVQKDSKQIPNTLNRVANVNPPSKREIVNNPNLNDDAPAVPKNVRSDQNVVKDNREKPRPISDAIINSDSRYAPKSSQNLDTGVRKTVLINENLMKRPIEDSKPIEEVNYVGTNVKKDTQGKTNLSIPVAKRLSDSFQNKKQSENVKHVNKREINADNPYNVEFNISNPDIMKTNPAKMSYSLIKNEIRKLLQYNSTNIAHGRK